MNNAELMAQSIVSGLAKGAGRDIALGKARDIIKEIRTETIEECVRILDASYDGADKSTGYKPTAFLVIAKQIRSLNKKQTK